MTTMSMAQLVALAEQEAVAQGVNPALVRAILVAENTGSGEFNPNQQVSPKTTSNKGAYGVSQILPTTWDSMVRQKYIAPSVDRHSPEGQVKGMVAVVRENMSRLGDDPLVLAAAYNTTADRAQRFRATGDESVLLPETKDYLRKVRQQLGGEFSGSNTDTYRDILSRTGESFSRGNELLRAMQGLTSDFVKDGKLASAAAEQQGEAKAASARAKGTSQVQQQDFMQNLLASLGVDATAPSGEFQRNRELAAAASAEVQALQPQLQALREVSFADNPLAWVAAQFKLQGLADRHNAAARTFNANMQIIGEKQMIAQRQANLQSGVSTDTIKLRAAAEADAELAEAKLKQFSIANSVKQAQLAAISAEQSQLDRQFSQVAQLHRMGQEKRLVDREGEKEKKDEARIRGVNEWRAKFDLAPYTAEQFASLPSAERERQLEYSSRPGNGAADTPGKAIAVLSDLGALSNVREKMPPQGKTFFDRFSQRALQGVQAEMLKNPKVKREDAFISSADAIAKQWREQQSAQDYSSLPADHPLAMNANVFAQAPELQNNSLAKYVLALPNGGAGSTPKDIVAYSIAQLRAGKSLQIVAGELTDFFEAGLRHQVASYRLTTFNIDPRNPKTDRLEFPIRGDVFGFFDRLIDPTRANTDKPVDLTNGAAVVNFLILQTVQQRGRTLQEQGVSPVLQQIKQNTSRGPGGIGAGQ